MLILFSDIYNVPIMEEGGREGKWGGGEGGGGARKN